MKKPYIISFANQKGGVGKTTSAINVASCVAEEGHKVLLLDCDPQGNTTSGVGINKKKTNGTVYDVITGVADINKVILKTKYSNLWVAPSTIELAGAEFDLIEEEHRERKLKEIISKIEEPFDYIIIDCPPSLGMLTINSLTASDGVIIPMQTEYYSLEGLSQLMITIKKVRERYNPDLVITGILITMHNARLNLSSQVLREIKKYYGDKLFPTLIPRNVTLSEAPGYGEPVNYYDKYSKGCKAYKEVAAELIKRTGK